MGTGNWVFKALLLVSVCTCGRAGWMAGVGKEARPLPTGPSPHHPHNSNTCIRTQTHTQDLQASAASPVAVSQPYSRLLSVARAPGPILLGPPWAAPPSETPDHIPAWPMSFQHPGPTVDAVSLKKALLTNCMLCVSPKTDPETRIWCKPLIWNVVPGAQ